MIKALELVISLFILFTFIIFTVSIYNSKNIDINIPNRYLDIIETQSKNNDFRELINDGNLENIYDLLYTQMDVEYDVEICDSVDENCTKHLDIEKNKSISYYFEEYNKTLYILLN